MGWEENLQPASFRGVTFDVMKTSETVSRDQAVSLYPNVDGGNVKDLGRKPRVFQMTAFVWGDNYEYQLQSLYECLDQPGAGELIHPVYGSVPSVVVTTYTPRHNADERNSCTIDLSFLEDKTGTALFSQQLPEQFGAGIFDELDTLNAELAEFFNAIEAPLKTINSLVKRARTVESTLVNTLLTFKDDVSFTGSELLSLATLPKQFVSEFSEVLTVHTSNVASSVPSLGSSAPVTTIGLPAATVADVATAPTVMSSWGSVTEDMDDVVALPESFINDDTAVIVPMPEGSRVQDIQDVKAVYMVMAVAELANAATAILSDDAQADILTPDDIEQLVNDVRTRTQSAIDFFRARYQPTQPLITVTQQPVGIMWQPVVSNLKTIALRLQDLGLLVLSRRPPLTRKQVAADSSFVLLAHLWYADYRRASELHRLNPDIINPNTITTGTVLNAYAK